MTGEIDLPFNSAVNSGGTLCPVPGVYPTSLQPQFGRNHPHFNGAQC